MNNAYNKITNAISRFMIICGVILFVFFIYSMKSGAYPENEIVLAVIKAVSLTDVPWRLLLFCSAAMEIIVGLFGLNLKKGTGMAGLSLVCGGIMTFLKVCDIIELLLTNKYLSVNFMGAVIFAVFYGLFTYCTAKQWNSH